MLIILLGIKMTQLISENKNNVKVGKSANKPIRLVYWLCLEAQLEYEMKQNTNRRYKRKLRNNEAD